MALSLNKLNTADAAFVIVKVTSHPDPASSDTNKLLIIALESAGVVYIVVLYLMKKLALQLSLMDMVLVLAIMVETYLELQQQL